MELFLNILSTIGILFLWIMAIGTLILIAMMILILLNPPKEWHCDLQEWEEALNESEDETVIF